MTIRKDNPNLVANGPGQHTFNGKDNPNLAVNGARQHAFNSTQETARLQSELTKLAQQGVDVSDVQADLTAGNVTAAMQWMAAYHQAHPAQNVNRTAWHGGSSTQGQAGGTFQPQNAGSGGQAGSHPWFHRPGRGPLPRTPEFKAGTESPHRFFSSML